MALRIHNLIIFFVLASWNWAILAVPMSSNWPERRQEDCEGLLYCCDHASVCSSAPNPVIGMALMTPLKNSTSSEAINEFTYRGLGTPPPEVVGCKLVLYYNIN